jgi:hypothetical protein
MENPMSTKPDRPTLSSQSLASTLVSKLKSVNLQRVDDRHVKVSADVIQANMMLQVRREDGGFDMDNFAHKVDQLYQGEEVFIVAPATKFTILHEDEFAHMRETPDGLMCCVIPAKDVEVLDEADDS